MRYLWRFLLACLLVLPLQGFAAEHAHHQNLVVDNATAHAAVAAHGTAVAQQHNNVHDHSHDSAQGPSDTCKHGSLCCTGVLVNTVQLPATATLPVSSTFPDPSSHNPSPTLAGLERPPKLPIL